MYFIQIYKVSKCYISVRSFDTNQEKPTIFNGLRYIIYSYQAYIISMMQPLPSPGHYAALKRPQNSEMYYFFLYNNAGIQGKEDRG